MYGDLQIAHGFVDGDEVASVIDWSEAAPGDALYELASSTLAHGHAEHPGDVIAGHGSEVDVEVIRGWWSSPTLQVAVLRSAVGGCASQTRAGVPFCRVAPDTVRKFGAVAVHHDVAAEVDLDRTDATR